MSSILTLSLPRYFLAFLLYCISSTAYAQEPADSQEASQETTPAAAHGVKSISPQCPTSQIGFDGVMYEYGTDCCIDGHYGVFFSSSPGLAGSCPCASTIGPEIVELPGPLVWNPPGGGPAPNPGPSYGPYLFIDDNLRKPMPTEFDLANVSCFSSYYTSRSAVGVTIELKDKGGNKRYFTLVRYAREMTVSDKVVNGRMQYKTVKVDTPILLLSRRKWDRTLKLAGGTSEVAPEKKIVTDPTFLLAGVDFSDFYFDVVEIPLPNPANESNVQTQKILMINRPDK